jgi:hypothetical protein
LSTRRLVRWWKSPAIIPWGSMSTRRKSSAKLNPPDSPQGDGVVRSTRSSRHLKSVTKKSIRPTDHQPPVSRTLKLQAQGSQLSKDPTLEELLQLQPCCGTQRDELNKEQLASERVEEAKEALGKLECEIVSALFPSSGLPLSFEEVAQRLGMTVKEVRDVADNALRGLRGTKSSRPRTSTVWN